MEDFERKVRITPLPVQEQGSNKIQIAEQASSSIVALLRRFLAVQHRRALAYTRLKRGFEDYMLSRGELAYQQLCSEITVEFNDCSKQVLEIESLFMSPDYCREDLAQLLRSVQTQEKEKLHSTAIIQVLKKAGCPSERLVSHANCRVRQSTGHECVHIQKITEASGTEEAEADAEYDNSLKEAIKGVQDTVVSINEYLEEISQEAYNMGRSCAKNLGRAWNVGMMGTNLGKIMGKWGVGKIHYPAYRKTTAQWRRMTQHNTSTNSSACEDRRVLICLFLIQRSKELRED